MWETIGNVLTSSNGVIIALLLVILVIVWSKYGLFKVKTDKITIGRESGERERLIIRQQEEYAKDALQAFEVQMPKFEGYNIWRGKTIVFRITIEIFDWISQNDIHTTDSYMKYKKKRVWDIVQKYTVADMFETQEFHDAVDKHVEEIIRNLVTIRKEYSK